MPKDGAWSKARDSRLDDRHVDYGRYARRGQTVEPFNDWFKGLFELDQQVWHRGLDNNRTQMLAAIFAYQLLVRYNYRRGNENGQVKWITDCL